MENLAALLGIDISMIRVMNVISAGGASRRRRAVDEDMFLEIEISDPPAPSIEYAEEDLYNTTLTNSTEGVPSNYTGGFIEFEASEDCTYTIGCMKDE